MSWFRLVTIRKASLRNSSVGEGDLRDSRIRAAAGCLDRKSLKRGVKSVIFSDCGGVGVTRMADYVVSVKLRLHE